MDRVTKSGRAVAKSVVRGEGGRGELGQVEAVMKGGDEGDEGVPGGEVAKKE